MYKCVHGGPDLLAVQRHRFDGCLGNDLTSPFGGPVRLVDQEMADYGAVRDVGTEIHHSEAIHQRLPLGETKGAVRILDVAVASHGELENDAGALGLGIREEGQNI